ncbi:MAG TPA: Asp-tRNA(Asn)/Glu-tRNA(Gln) amidotransferase subunit GatC [Candidatus Peribacterales bacterium]|nr:Asp-tRNA(Asn)/Glu-tRNA(Gln) amidotransferase subunit GatC [Candidatus Peribacterales bacterium]
MAQLTEEQVRHIAKLARLRLSDVEVQKFTKELCSIFGYIDMLNELDTEHVEPTAQITGLTNVMRRDEVHASEATTSELLACSPLPIIGDQIETHSAHG